MNNHYNEMRREREKECERKEIKNNKEILYNYVRTCV